MQPSWAFVINELIQRNDLDPTHARWVMEEILNGRATDARLAAFATLLRAKGETPGEIGALLDVIYDFASPMKQFPDALDTAGTGGDRSGSVNISTMAALTAAAAGVRVVKHGNRSASSMCGAADLLEALGAVIDLDGSQVEQVVDEVGFGFCFAQRFHSSFKYVAPVRKELEVPTTFNFLGPLANPARVQHQLLGVSDPKMLEPLSRALAARGNMHAIVFHGHGGLDELNTFGVNQTWEVKGEDLRLKPFDPAGYGFGPIEIVDLKGGDAATNAAVTRNVLGGERGPIFEVVVVNAGVAIYVADKTQTIQDGLELARETLASGTALETLDAYITMTNKVAGDTHG